MDQDKDYVIKIIQYLQNRHGIIFFISSNDFNTLYHWWEKRIPFGIIKESISQVIERWKVKKKGITGFSNFRYEVKKNFSAFLQLGVGSERDDKDTDTHTSLVRRKHEEIEAFFENYPVRLLPLREDFELLYDKIKKRECADLTGVYEKLTALFKADEELGVQTAVFLKNLSPALRKPEIEQRYRLNYLLNKFNIPDFSPGLPDEC